MKPAATAGRSTERTAAAVFAAAAFAVFYLLPGALRLPVVFYDPLGRGFAIARALPSPWIRYYGDLLYATAAALFAFALGFRLTRNANLGTLTGAALSLVALDVLFYLSRLVASV
ncbi:MAG TPA: hypothetical protein VGH20_13410 [Myxococcales bacterium]|jgi:hypothetical protein